MVSFSHCGASAALVALLLPSFTLSSPLPQASTLPSTENTFTVAGLTNSLTVQVNSTHANTTSTDHTHGSPPPTSVIPQNVDAALTVLFNSLRGIVASSGSINTELQNPTNITVNGTIAGITPGPVPAHSHPLTCSDAALVVSGLQQFLLGSNASLVERVDFTVNATLPLESSVFGETTRLVATGFVESAAGFVESAAAADVIGVPAGGQSLESSVFAPGT